MLLVDPVSVQTLTPKLMAEAKRRLAVVTETVELLVKEGIFDQAALFPISTQQSEKYKTMSMTQAIMSILESTPLHKAPARVIFSGLQKNGFKSTSSDLRRDLYTRLFRLVKNGKLLSTKEQGIKIYSLISGEDLSSKQ